MSDLVKNIQTRISEVDSNDELFNEIDIEVYDEEFDRLES